MIVAGGAGLRMINTTPKQFLLLQGKPVLWHTANAFRQAYFDIHLVLVVPQAHLQNEVVKAFLAEEKTTVVQGGETRFHSVKNGLEEVLEAAVVFVQDGVRCLTSVDLIQRCYVQTLSKGNAVPVVAATDSLRIDKEGAHCVINRQHIRLVQTPQTFLSSHLKAAFQQTYTDAFTDEATVMEAFGKEIFLIDGEYENIKITRPLDLLLAEKILEQRLSFQ